MKFLAWTPDNEKRVFRVQEHDIEKMTCVYNTFFYVCYRKIPELA
jgi:hypothetical protein